ncbi:MAG: hypothetical protein KJ043_22525, partial [Anaerolineae bacterium]|nr:hypothetical protein [Anaerolineae bacterium]
CKGIKGKIICFVVEEIISWFVDWWNEDDTESQEAVVDLHKLTSTIFIPARSENMGDPRTAVGSDYPWCDDILKDIIIQHTTDDGTSPIQSEVIGDYLVTYLVVNPDIPLPQQQPCKKWLDGASDDGNMDGYLVEYDSWPPNGWNTDILGGNSTVPVMALLLPAVQKVREAAFVTPFDGALVIDFLGNSTVDENGGVFFNSLNYRQIDRFLF